MHYVAGALLLAQFALMWVLDDSIDVQGLETVAWATWLVAATLLAVSMLTLRSRGQVQEGRSCVETEALVATGVYALVRHPLYLGWMLMYLVMILFKPNWILAVLGIVGAACIYRFTVQEEALLEGKFGPAYRGYMQVVPRFNLVAGVVRLLQKRCVGDSGAPHKRPALPSTLSAAGGNWNLTLYMLRPMMNQVQKSVRNGLALAEGHMAPDIQREPDLEPSRQAMGHILGELGLPALVFALGVGLSTGNWPASFATGLAISGAIAGLNWLDRRFLQPRLEKVSPDWMRLGLEMTFLMLDHLVGAVAALLVCSRVFGFTVVPSAAWLAVAAMVVVFPIIHGTEIALRFFRQVQEKERQEEQLKALATEAELKALKAQINPHFLFNTLNTIAELIHADSAKAEATVERLAEMFRYVLDGSDRGLVPLEEELAFLDGYLEIERARFGPRLRVTRQITPEALGLLVPSLVLQPLVENTVRHGQGAGGSIDLGIDILISGDQAVIAISDQGPGMPAGHRVGKSPGHGLHNVDQRLQKTYGEAYGLEISANQPRGAVVTLSIPLGAGG